MAYQDKNKKTPGKSEARVNQMVLGRTLLVMIVCGIVAFIPLAVKMYSIMIVDHDKYENMAVQQQTRESTVKAERGTIYDRNMNVLATNITEYNIFIAPNELAEYDMDISLIAGSLSDILGVNSEDILAKSEKVESQYQIIKKGVDQETSELVRTFISENDIRGVYIESNNTRYYPYGSLAAQIIGFTGTDGYGLYGIETEYNDTLEGTDGLIVTITDAEGNEMLYKYSNYQDAVEGDSVVLTIDATMQYYLEKHLTQAISDYGVQNGAVGIIMDVDSGDILAMSTLESFDLNNYQAIGDEKIAEQLNQLKEEGSEDYLSLLAEAQLEQWGNKAVSLTYEPGSTFKAITMSILLEEDLAKDSDTYYCSGSTGSMYIAGRKDPISCWKKGGHGLETLAETLQNSCNPAFATYGLRIGSETFFNYLEAFGFMDETGVDLPGESGSIFWSEETKDSPYFDASLAVAAFGQTFKITPIQLADAYCALANGGYLMTPHTVSKVLDPEGNIVEETSPEVVRQVISEDTSKRLCEMLGLVVSDGTGRNAQVSGYQIGGKTGTSEKTDVYDENGNESNEVMVSFVGVAPIDDPQIVGIVILDTPTIGYCSGGTMAAPTAAAIFEDVLPYMGIEPSYTQEQMDSMDVEVDNYVGMTLSDASDAMHDSFNYKIIGSGSVITDQLPAPGTEVSQGSYLLFFTDGGNSGETMVTVPNLVGYSQQWCVSELNYIGLYMTTTGVIATDANSVTASTQSIEAGTEVPLGTIITVRFVDSDVGD